MREYSDDIFRVQEAFQKARDETKSQRGNNYYVVTDRALLDFKFNIAGALKEDWRPPFITAREAKSAEEKMMRGNAGPSSQFKALQDDLRDACIIQIQGHTGMRVSEVLGLTVLPRDKYGMPACLISRPSPSGLYEMFFIKGRIFKGRDGDMAEGEWLAGVRPVGSEWLPDAVVAILVLDKLLAHLRDMYGDDHLIVSSGLGKGPPRRIAADPYSDRWRIKDDTIRDGQRAFVKQHVTLPGTHADWRITTRQFRSRWAQDIIEIDPSITQSVKEQLHHRMMVTTETAYVGNDPSLNRLKDDSASRHTASVIHDFVFGEQVAAGQMSDTLLDYAPSIKDFCAQFSSKDAQVTALTEILENDGIRLWRGDHGDCLFNARMARCHQLEFGEFDLRATL